MSYPSRRDARQPKEGVVADKSTQLVLSALSHAAAAGTGMPLHGVKGSSGLFPPTALGRQAAQRCQEEGWLGPAEGEPGPAPGGGAAGRKSRPAAALFVLTDKGLAHLLSQASPRQVIEDFVRVLEARHAEVGELLALARHMQAGVEALKAHAAQVLHSLECGMRNAASDRETALPHAPGELNALFQTFIQAPGANGATAQESEAGPRPAARALADRVLEQLAGWQGSGAAEDCPLPELYRRVGGAPGLTVGRFHDAVRALHEAGQVYLHPWTGPLYDIPEPPYALLVGHEVAYYASVRQSEVRS
jgi:hypothetical protein